MPKFHTEVIWNIGIDMSQNSAFVAKAKADSRSGKDKNVG